MCSISLLTPDGLGSIVETINVNKLHPFCKVIVIEGRIFYKDAFKMSSLDRGVGRYEKLGVLVY